MPTIVVLEGDETGQELLEEALRVLAPGVTGVELDRSERFDLSLENRRATKTGSCTRRRRPISEPGLGLKAATDHPRRRATSAAPTGSCARRSTGSVIVRTGRRIPGVAPIGGVHAPISVVRMAVGDAYGAKEWREGEGDDEVAFRTSHRRRICRAVAEFAFRHAERTRREGLRRAEVHRQPGLRGHAEGGDGRGGRAPPGGGVRAAADRRDVCAAARVRRRAAGDPALNRDGDILTDLVLPLFGSIAGSESLLVAFDDDFTPRGDHGRGRARNGAVAPGQERRQPAGDDPGRGGASLARGREAQRRAGDPRGGLEAVASGVRTADLGGHAARPSSPTR